MFSTFLAIKFARFLVYILKDPLILDLDGDGIAVSALDGSDVVFDYDGDGVAERTGWASADDGFLAIDTNGNGVIDTDDAVFATLRVWRDRDQDGVTDAGELQTLTEAGIAQIALTRRRSDRPTPANEPEEGVNRQRKRNAASGQTTSWTHANSHQ